MNGIEKRILNRKKFRIQDILFRDKDKCELLKDFIGQGIISNQTFNYIQVRIINEYLMVISFI